MVVGSVFAGYLSDRVFEGRRKIPIVLGTTLYTMNWVLLEVVAASQEHLQLLMLLLFTLGITSSIAHVPILGLVADLSPRHLYGTVFGIHNMFPFIGSTVFQGIMGRILDMSRPVIESGVKVFPLRGYLWAFAFCMVAALFAALLAVFIKKPTSSGNVK